MSWEHYEPRTLSGAKRHIRSLEKTVENLQSSYAKLHSQFERVAKLSIPDAKWSSEIEKNYANKLRDQILNGEL